MVFPLLASVRFVRILLGFSPRRVAKKRHERSRQIGLDALQGRGCYPISASKYSFAARTSSICRGREISRTTALQRNHGTDEYACVLQLRIDLVELPR